MKKAISIAINSHKKLAVFSYSIDEDLFGKESYEEMAQGLLESLTAEGLYLAFNLGYISISQSYGSNKRREL